MMVFRQALQEHRFLAIGYFLLLLVNLLAGTFYWPELRDHFPEALKFIPIETLQDFVRAFERYGYWAYFAVQHYFKGAGMFGIAAAGLIGSGIVAREVDRRTAEFLLSRPVSRARLLFTRWLAGVVLLLVPYLAVAIIGWALAPRVDEHLHLGLVVEGTLYTFLFILMAFTATMALSTRFSHQLKAGILVLGLLLMQLAMYMIDTLWDYSLYNLIDLDITMPLDGGPFPWLEAGWMIAFTLLFYGLALWGFRRRDF